MESIQAISFGDENTKISFICSCLDTIQKIITMAMKKTNPESLFSDFEENGTVYRRVLKTPPYGRNSKSFKTIEDAYIPELRHRTSLDMNMSITIMVIELRDCAKAIHFDGGPFNFKSEAWFEIVRIFESIKDSEIIPK